MNKFSAVFLAAVLLFTPAYAADFYTPEPLTNYQWQQDIEQFRDFVFATHPKFADEELAGLERNIEINIAFNQALDRLIAELPWPGQVTEFEIRVGLQRAAATLQDNHFQTLIDFDLEADGMLVFPLDLRWLADGIYLLTTVERFEEVLNHRLIGISGIYIGRIFEVFNTLWGIENIYNARASFASMISNPIVLKALGLFNGEYINFGFEIDDESMIIIALTADDKVNVNSILTTDAFPVDNRNDGVLPLFMDIRTEIIEIPNFEFDMPTGQNWFYYIEDYGVLYLRLELYLQDLDWETFEIPFIHDVKAFLEEFEPTAVIIDARNNPGGDNSYLAELFELIADSVDEGMLFHFVDEGSLSASLLGAAHLLSLGATIIGQPPGQNTEFYGFHSFSFGEPTIEFINELIEAEILDLDMYVEAVSAYETVRITLRQAIEIIDQLEMISNSPDIILNNSGISISVPNWFVSASRIYEIELDLYALVPHIRIDYTIYHWINNIDPALEHVLNIFR